jgi:tetratricopeptide (TPR) repeat protein
VALMDQGNYSEAFGSFQTACIMVPDSNTGCLNSGIALIAMKQYDEARKILTTDVSREAENPRAWFTLGLLNRIESQNDAALENFERAAALDPHDAPTECLIGDIYENEGNNDSASEAFRKALAIDPLSAAAESGLADALGKTGDTAGQKAHQSRYQRLTNLQLSEPLGNNYGEQGQYSLAAEIPPPTVVPAAIPIQFTNVTQLSGLPLPVHAVAARATARGRRGRGAPPAKPVAAAPPINTMADFLGSGACVFDYDGDGLPDVFLDDADGEGHAALYHNLGHGRFVDVTKESKIEIAAEGMGCAVGDYDNDGHPDLAVSFNGGIALFHNEGNGTFADLTSASGIHAEGLVMGVSFINYDRDGRVDLYATRFHDIELPHPNQPFVDWPADAPPGNMLWRNAGNGTFIDATNDLSVAGGASATGMLASDFTNSGALDFLLTGLGTTPNLLLNPREGAFQAASPWGAETQGPTAGGVAFDFDKDGRMDVALTHWQPTTLGLWRNVDGKAFERVALPDPGWMRAWGIAALDYDRDGWIDLVAVGDTFSGEGRITLLRNEGGKGFHDVTPETGLDKIALHDPRSVIPFDADGDGSLYLLITQNHRPPILLKAAGDNAHSWAKFALKGDTENEMGIGAKVEMFSGALRQTWEVPGASGYLSQGPATIVAGLGDQRRADAVRVQWSKGPRQAQISVPAGRTTVISQQGAQQSP